jgi:hypothetical protein
MAALCGKTAGARANAPFKAEADDSAEVNPWTGDVNPYTGTPYGECYDVDCSTKQIIIDAMGQKCMGWTDWGQEYGTYGVDARLYGTNFVNATDGSLTKVQPDPDMLFNNGSRMNATYLKKMCQQKVADGTFNTLKISYDVVVPDYNGSRYWLASAIEGKEGHLILEVFGNKETNFALQKKITLPGDPYVMTAFDGFKEDDRQWSEDLRVNEFYMKRLNIMAADFNNDGVDDIVVGFCDRWTVLDGKDYTTVLAQRTFSTDCVRACVGDLDKNGLNDIGIIYQENKKYYVYVLLDDINKFDGTKNPNLDDVSCQ